MSEEKTPEIPLISVEEIKTDLRKKEPPLVNLQVSNPVTYLKSWWKRVMSGEGVDLHFKIKPLTAIAITFIIATVGFGVGRFSFTTQKPFIQYVPVVTPLPMVLPTPDPWRNTAFSGNLHFSVVDNLYYMTTSASEAITLEVPETVDLSGLISRRIFATGKYNDATRVLIVTNASDLEVLPKKIETVPEVSPSPEPTQLPVVLESSSEFSQ